jgi:Bacterial Ig domain
VTVNPVNQPPTLNSISNYTVVKNAAAQTVFLSGISSGAANEIQTLKITAVSGNRKLVSPPTVVYTSPGSTGSLIFKPMTNATGTTTFTVTVNDGARSNNIIQKTFTVTIANSVQPQIAAAVQTQMAPMVQSMPATLQPVAPVNGMFTLAVEGSAGMTYIVQASSDLSQWESVQTNQAPFTYTDEQAGQFNQRFYRTISAP